MDPWHFVQRDMEETSREFYRRLREDRAVFGLRCRECGNVNLPPRRRCRCGSSHLAWERVPGTGRIYAFTTQERGMRFAAPAVLALVDIDGGGRLLGVIDAPNAKLAIGMEVALEPRDIDGSTLIGFRVLDST
jgi:uncharacterized protein